MVLGLAAQRPQPAKTKGLRVFFFFLINPGKILCKLNCHQSFTFHHLETRGRPLTSLAFGICEPEHPVCVHGAVVPWPRGPHFRLSQRTAYQRLEQVPVCVFFRCWHEQRLPTIYFSCVLRILFCDCSQFFHLPCI